MSNSRRVFPGDEQLFTAIRELGGEPPSARQLERWRQAGGIPGADRTWPGGGGSEASYPDALGVAPQVMELACLVDRYRNLSKAILVLFTRGWPVEKGGLQHAYAWIFAHMDSELRSWAMRRDPEITSESSSDELADAAGPALVDRAKKERIGRFMLRNIRRMPEREDSPDSVFGGVLTNLIFLGWTGEPFSDTDELIEAVGYRPSDDDMTNLYEAAQRLAYPALQRVIDGASMRELELARDLIHALVMTQSKLLPPRGRLDPLDDGIAAGLRMFGLGAPLLGELAVAVHIPMLLIFLLMVGVTVEEFHTAVFKTSAQEGPQEST